MPAEYITSLFRKSKTKIVMLILDGLGGLPIEPGGQTELEAAHTPNMDKMAQEGTLGQILPIRPGITPGSGPAHLALFGYDPLTYQVGRGALEATGVGMHVSPGDVAVRGNLCTLDDNGVIVDRRAGRISSEDAAPIVAALSEIEIEDAKFEVQHVKEYRFAVIMRADNLSADLTDTDPQRTGVSPLQVQASSPKAEHSAQLFNQWIAKAHDVLSGQQVANGLTLRGFGTDPVLPSYQQLYGLDAACIAVYPMSRGVSKLVGMNIIDLSGEEPIDEFKAAQNIWDDHDFFFIHIKKTDSRGEDGDFPGKVRVIESVDDALPMLLGLNPDVVVITGDHSTPSKFKSHSWHPVPLLLWSPHSALPDLQTQFGERACAIGGLGTFPATDIMPLALAHAEKLNKFGA
ncbi:MAG: 2,3-bisphosphoglycerate-independent phosphoglycerate mutase [Chloroflexota bacterium]